MKWLAERVEDSLKRMSFSVNPDGLIGRLVAQALLRWSYVVRSIQVRNACGEVPEGNDPAVLAHVASLDQLFQASARNFESLVAPWRREFRWMLGRLYNYEFATGDAELYYSVIRTYRPSLVIEIGSGHSTRFALDAIKRNGRGEILCIDPEPRSPLPRAVTHLKCRVEDVELSLFSRLAKGDVLFIDSSHTAEEGRYHVSEILPKLCGGVLVHHHDIMYPYRREFAEEEVVLDYYATHRDSYSVLASLAFVRAENPDLLLAAIPSFRLRPWRVPGSLWMVVGRDIAIPRSRVKLSGRWPAS